MLYLALGYLHVDERFMDQHADLYHEMLVNQALQQEVALVLTEHFALSEQESQEYINSYGDDYHKRIDSDLDYGSMNPHVDREGHMVG
jgi:hypothetical protein